MSVEISSIKNAELREIALKADKNEDGKLKRDEYSVFTKEAQKAGVDYKAINEALDMNGLQRWWYDVDKVSKDGNDDGHLSFGESALSFAKGLGGGLIKGILKNPLKSLAGLGAVVGLSILTGGAILPLLAVAGVAIGTGMVVAGSIQNAKADNDGDAKRGLETAGTGAATAILSMLGIKSANKAAARGGVEGLEGLENKNIFVNFGRAIRTLPEQIKVAGMNTKGNALTWISALKGDKVLYMNSNAMRSFGPQQKYMSKANDVQAYRFNPNGTQEEILANNPGVFAKDGNYYIPNKWNPSEPYLIDPSKEQMIMLYGGDDMAVCDGGVFRASYVNTAEFKADGSLNYVEPSAQNYGQVLNVTKQAPGSFQVAPEGTKIMTLEGVRTVKAGEVVAYDAQGNPYATPVANILKRNTGLSQEAIAELAKIDLAAIDKTPEGRAYILLTDNNPAVNAYLEEYGIQNIEFIRGNISSREHHLCFTYNGKTYDENLTPGQLVEKLLNGTFEF